MMAQRDRKNVHRQSTANSGHSKSTNIYKMYLEAKLNLLEVLHGNLHLKLEAQSIKEQFLSLLESFNEYEDKFIGNGCPIFAPSPIKNAEGVAAARARVRTMYEARRVSINARRLRMQGVSPRKLQFPYKKEKCIYSGKEHIQKGMATNEKGNSSRTSWETPTSNRNKTTLDSGNGNFTLGNISAINLVDKSPPFSKPSPTWGPLHSTVLDVSQTQEQSKVKKSAKSSSDSNVSRLGDVDSVLQNCQKYKHMDRTFSRSCCECNSIFRSNSNCSYTSQVHRNRGPMPDDIFTEQCDMLESMRYKIRELECQILRKPNQGANSTQCSACSTCSCDQYEYNKENAYGSLVQSTPCPVKLADSKQLSEFGSYTDLSDISSCSSPKKRKMNNKKYLSDSELYSNKSGSIQVSPIINQFSALDLSEQLYPSMIESPMRKSFRVPSLLINFDHTEDGLPSASLVSRTPSGGSETNPNTSTGSPSSRVSSFVSTPLYPSTAHATSDEDAADNAAVRSDPHSDPQSDQDKTIMSQVNHSDPDVTIKSNVVRFDVSPSASPTLRLRRQVGQTKLEPGNMRETLGLTVSDLLDNTISSNITEVTGSGGYASLGATCASSPNFSEFGSQTSDSSLGSVDITASIFPNNGRRAGSHSSFKESDGLWSDSSLNVTVRAKHRRNVTPAESQNDLLVPVNSPNATNSSGSSRPATDSNDRVDVMEFDYHKVRSQMVYRPRRYSSRPSPIGKSLRDDSNNNQVQQKYGMGPPPSRSSTFGRQNQQNIPPSSRNPRQRKTATDGDSGFSTQNSQYANDRALAVSHQSVYSEHTTTTSSQATSTNTTLSQHRKKQVVKRMKQYSSAMHINTRQIRESKSSLQSFGYV